MQAGRWLLLAWLLPASMAGAQSAFRVGLGADIPIGGSADLFKNGYHTSAGFAFNNSFLRHVVRIDGAITELRTRDSVPASHKIQYLTADIVIASPSKISPSGYVVLGLGAYQQSSAAMRSSDVGANVGAGISFPRRIGGTYIEARLHYIPSEKRTKLCPLTVGLAF